jgi:hypothetical protein
VREGQRDRGEGEREREREREREHLGRRLDHARLGEVDHVQEQHRYLRERESERRRERERERAREREREREREQRRHLDNMQYCDNLVQETITWHSAQSYALLPVPRAAWPGQPVLSQLTLDRLPCGAESISTNRHILRTVFITELRATSQKPDTPRSSA